MTDFRDGYVADARTGVRLSTFHGSAGLTAAQWLSDGTGIVVGNMAGVGGDVSVLDADTGTLLQHVEGKWVSFDERDRLAISTGNQVRIRGRMARYLNSPIVLQGDRATWIRTKF